MLGLYKGFKDDNKIRYRHQVFCATITGMHYSKGGWSINYEFKSGKRKISSFSSSNQSTKKRYDQGLLHILCVAEKENPDNAELLENQSDFERYGITKNDTIGLVCY